jgi:hypothetical protein
MKIPSPVRAFLKRFLQRLSDKITDNLADKIAERTAKVIWYGLALFIWYVVGHLLGAPVPAACDH